MPFFSIIIPSYNRASLIQNALNALIDQSFKDIEVIIVDDGSADNTKEMVQPILHQHPFIKYIFQENKGVCAARNNGARQATGKFLIFLDSDDCVTPDWLNDFFMLLKDGKYDVGFCNMKEVHANGVVKFVNAENPYNNTAKKGKYIAGMFAINVTVFRDAGMYDEHIKFGENTELGIRLRSKNVIMGFVDKNNFIYNVSTTGGSKNDLNKLESNTYMVEKHKDYFKKNPTTKRLFIQVAAVAAARLGRYKKANELFKSLLMENKSNLKLWVQYIITLIPFLAKLKWQQK
jgi:glycosyltransferase involved in cell wall biosynthesis